MYTVNGIEIGLSETVLARNSQWEKAELPNWFAFDALYSLKLDESANEDLDGCYAYLSESKVQKVLGRVLEFNEQEILARGDRWEKSFETLNSVPPEGFDGEKDGASVFYSTIALSITYSHGKILSFMLSEPGPSEN